MKRIAVPLLSLLLALSLAACGKPATTSSEAPPPAQSADGVPAETNTTPDVIEVNNMQAPEGFVLITGGSFEMGSPESENWRSDDESQHAVSVSDFYMGQYEVTQAEYQAAMGENPSNFSGDALPVENLSWLEAVRYCNARSEQESLSPAYRIDGEQV